MKRTICIANPCTLSTKARSLIIEGSSMGKASIPLEDIWVVIVESQQVRLSSSLLSSLSDVGIGLMTCGTNHMPNGLHLPIGAHSRHAAIVENQLLMSKPLKKRLWKRIVISKITNQARCLELLDRPGSQRLYDLAKDLHSGDSTNREAVAASVFFRNLIDKGNRRNGPFEGPLNYGYSILRAGVARCAVSGGWLVSQGIFHDSKLNAFNLADDFIEPFRPAIDLLVASNDIDNGLTPDLKHKLASIFEYLVLMDEKRYSIQNAIELMFDSFKSAVLENDPDCLILPKLLPLEKVRIERG